MAKNRLVGTNKYVRGINIYNAEKVENRWAVAHSLDNWMSVGRGEVLKIDKRNIQAKHTI